MIFRHTAALLKDKADIGSYSCFMSGLSLSAFYKDPGFLLSNRYDSPEKHVVC